MTPFVLVHGGCHGAWCWDRVMPHLVGEAVQLPGHGKGAARAGLSEGIAAVCDALERIGEPVVLVGHSLGGMTISGAAEAMPDSISQLIYLTALLPVHGELAATLPLPILGATAATRPSSDGRWAELDPALAPSIFYQDCDLATVDWALARVGPTDHDYMTTAVSLTEQFSRTPKTYVHCVNDRAIQIEAQRIMAKRYSDIRIVTIISGHSPFLSTPDHLVAMLLRLAQPA